MLQDAQPDDTIILWNYKGYSNLHGSINCTDNIGLDLRIPAGSCVSLNLFIRPKYSLVPTTLRLYWIGLYEGRESNKSNWFFQVDLAAATIYGTKRIVGGVSTHMLPAVVLVLMLTNKHTVAGVLFFLDGVFSLITFIVAVQMLVFFAAWIVFGGGHFHALGTGFLIFGCTVCAITRKKLSLCL